MTVPKFLSTLIFVSAVTFILSCGVLKAEEAKAKDGATEERQEGLIRLSKESHDILGIETARATSQALEKYIRATAEIEFNANRVFHIGPRVRGRVVDIFMDLGDDVEEGQKLAMLNSVELGNAVSEYLTSNTRMSVDKAHFEREKMLWEKRVSSEREMLDAKSAYLQAKAEFEAAENKLHLFGLNEDDVRALKSETHSVTTFPLRSPFSGTVVEKHIALGEMVNPSDKLFTVADLEALWIILNIYEKDLASINVGQETKVSVSAYPEAYFHSQIAYISDTMDERTRTVKVRVEIDNSERKLKPGMFAKARIIMTEDIPGQKKLVIPSSAVESYKGRKVVFMALGNYTYEMKEVQVGDKFNGQVEILAGLREGDEVVATGGFYLKSELQKEMLEHD